MNTALPNPLNDRWRRAVLPPTATLQDAVQNLNEVAIRVVLVLDSVGRLEGTVTDGDIRRGLLRGLTLDACVAEVLRRQPLVVPKEMSRDLVLQLMAANKIQQIPAVDEENRLVGLHLWDDLATPVELPNLLVIMAGGMGRRLRPHTESCPKPMLPVAGKPMLQHIIDRARGEGFVRIVLTLHYLGGMIEEFFGDGERFGVRIEYVKEESPLGTAGALSLLQPCPDKPFVVTNGDVVTDIRYSELLHFHHRHRAAATMAVRLHEWEHPFGVVHMNGVDIVGFEEKPVSRHHINAGVYALSPCAIQALGKGAACDMPSLFERLQAQGMRTVAFPMHEPWLDVGRSEDLANANQHSPS